MGLDLAGKRAIVTGGGTGIGFAVARELAGEKVSVAISGRRESVLLDAAARIRDDLGAEVLPVVVDTGSNDSVQALVATVEREVGGAGSARPSAPSKSVRPGLGRGGALGRVTYT